VVLTQGVARNAELFWFLGHRPVVGGPGRPQVLLGLATYELIDTWWRPGGSGVLLSFRCVFALCVVREYWVLLVLAGRVRGCVGALTAGSIRVTFVSCSWAGRRGAALHVVWVCCVVAAC